MVQVRLFKSLIITIFLLSISSQIARASFNQTVTCPSSFKGEVTSVDDILSPLGPLRKVEVTFATRSGQKLVSVVKNGPVKFDVGVSYKVSMRGKYICDVELI